MNKLFSWTLASLLLPNALAEANASIVEMQTNMPSAEPIILELDSDKSPITVANFLTYLNNTFAIML